MDKSSERLTHRNPDAPDHDGDDDDNHPTTTTLRLQFRATSTEASNGSTASLTQDLTVVVLTGTAVATPVGVNPYVNLSSASGTATGPAPVHSEDPIVRVGVPLVDATGTLQITVAPAGGGSRSWEEEEAADAQTAKQLQDAWLRELEAAARVQWGQG